MSIEYTTTTCSFFSFYLKNHRSTKKEIIAESVCSMSVRSFPLLYLLRSYFKISTNILKRNDGNWQKNNKVITTTVILKEKVFNVYRTLIFIEKENIYYCGKKGSTRKKMRQKHLFFAVISCYHHPY